jgi:glycosidase
LGNHLQLVLIVTVSLFLQSLGLAQEKPARDFSNVQARKTAAWARDGVIYEIFPRVFSRTGDFNGITARLDDLKDLGVNILWLMPIHPAGRLNSKGTFGSPYAVKDYFSINPDYGTAADFKRLVSEAHRRGMKVIIDIVANHTAWDSVMMKTPEFYTHDAKGKIIPPLPDWSDVADLNYADPALRDYMVRMMVYWLKEFDLDGFRCDVAGMVPTDFWDRARSELSKIKPDIVMLAEAHQPDLLVEAFDVDYSWPMHSKLTDVLQGRARASEFQKVWEEERQEFPRGALHMRFSDNHDERRAIARFGEPAALAASAFMFTLDGVPMIYNGMEVGDTAESGAPALFEKIPILWQMSERRPEFPRFYKQIIELRRSNPALTSGSLEWIRNSDEARVVSYARRGGNEEFLIVINFSSQPVVGLVETTTTNGLPFEDITPTVGRPLPPDAPPPERMEVARRVALPAISLDAWGYRIFRRKMLKSGGGLGARTPSADGKHPSVN